MAEKHYDPNIFEVNVNMTLMVTASNERHAEKRVEELLDSRITQYIHPEDHPPKFRVIGVVRDFLIDTNVRRLRIIEGQSERPEVNSETES